MSLTSELERAGAVAVDVVADVHRLDQQLRQTKKRITAAGAASKTTVTQLYGVGPIVAATVGRLCSDDLELLTAGNVC
jgi:hypothetical protein